MSETKDEGLSADLLEILGEADFLQLVERYGGQRLYVPAGDEDTAVVRALGRKAARLLAASYGRTYLRIPLARAFRARQYRAAGMSNAEIARKLVITETGVDKLFSRMDDKPAKGVDPRQLKLFG